MIRLEERHHQTFLLKVFNRKTTLSCSYVNPRQFRRVRPQDNLWFNLLLYVVFTSIIGKNSQIYGLQATLENTLFFQQDGPLPQWTIILD